MAIWMLISLNHLPILQNDRVQGDEGGGFEILGVSWVVNRTKTILADA